MDTNGMDTDALVAVVADAVLSVVARHDRVVTAGSAGEKPAMGGPFGPPGQANDGRKSRLRPSCARPFAAG